MTGQTHKIEDITQQSNPGQSEERAKHGWGGSVERDGCVPKKTLRSLSRWEGKYFTSHRDKGRIGLHAF